MVIHADSEFHNTKTVLSLPASQKQRWLTQTLLLLHSLPSQGLPPLPSGTEAGLAVQ